MRLLCKTLLGKPPARTSLHLCGRGPGGMTENNNSQKLNILTVQICF